MELLRLLATAATLLLLAFVAVGTYVLYKDSKSKTDVQTQPIAVNKVNEAVAQNAYATVASVLFDCLQQYGANWGLIKPDDVYQIWRTPYLCWKIGSGNRLYLYYTFEKDNQRTISANELKIELNEYLPKYCARFGIPNKVDVTRVGNYKVSQVMVEVEVQL